MKIIVDQKQAFELEKSLQLPPHLRTLHTLDFDKFFLIIVFQGEKPTTRYSVEVVDVRRAGNVITVYARFLTPPTPAPGEIVGVGNIVTSPYYVLKVKKPPHLKGEFTFVLVADGKEIMKKKHFIP